MTTQELVQICNVWKNGTIVFTLSPALAQQQGLKKDDIDNLKRLHILRLDLFETMEKETDVTVLKQYVKLLEDIEFAMQRGWKFQEDRNLHSWWWLAPHCTCKRGTEWPSFYGTRYINLKCILHGNNNE